jgi:hypothetical protein
MSSENPVATVPSSEIATVNVVALQAQSRYQDEDFSGISGNRTAFLPRLQLFTSNSEQVKAGKIPLAHYGLVVGEELTDLGKEVLAIPLAWRAKAMYVKADPVLAYHDAKSAEFQDIKKKADADSNSGNLYGPEFLVWLGPTHGFVTFFMASKTARNSAVAVRALLPLPDGRMRVGLLTAEFIKTSEYSWHGPKMVVSAQSLELPAQDSLETTIADFLNPKDSVTAEAAPAGAVADVR